MLKYSKLKENQVESLMLVKTNKQETTCKYLKFRSLGLRAYTTIIICENG